MVQTQPLKWKIGSVSIDNPLVLAPMEGVNCSSFRILCKEFGAGLIYTDMVDTKQFLEILKETNDEKETVRRVINPQKNERPLSIQLGSGSPEELALVTQIVTKYADIIDLNLGCPLGDMLGRKGGVYLMKHPEKLSRMLPSLLDHATVPVTAKIRSGWSDSERNAVEIAKQLEHEGIAAIGVHGRTRKQRYMARADWTIIKDVVDSVSIPVIGNGDVSSGARAVTLKGQTGCQGVMIARAAQGNPHIFEECNQAFANKRYEETPWTLRSQSFLRFLDLYAKQESRFRLSELQDHASWWVSGRSDADLFRTKIRKTNTLEELRALFE